MEDDNIESLVDKLTIDKNGNTQDYFDADIETNRVNKQQNIKFILYKANPVSISYTDPNNYKIVMKLGNNDLQDFNLNEVRRYIISNKKQFFIKIVAGSSLKKQYEENIKEIKDLLGKENYSESEIKFNNNKKIGIILQPKMFDSPEDESNQEYVQRLVSRGNVGGMNVGRSQKMDPNKRQFNPGIG